MSRFAWSRLTLGARIGVLVVLVPLILLAPFLAYAGIALMNVSVDWARSAGGAPLAFVVGPGSIVAYFVIVFGVPSLLGGLVGTAVQRVFSRVKGRVA
jgi:hypothetical protein